MSTPTSLRPRATRLAAAFALGLGLMLGVAGPADAAKILLKDGKELQADQVYFTYTDLVLVSGTQDLQLIANDRIRSVDGVAFEQAYWASQPGEKPDATAGRGEAVAAGAWPLNPGTLRRYALEKTITTWVRHGITQDRRAARTATGYVTESVDGLAKNGRIGLTELIHEQLDGKPAHDVRLVDVLESRADGYYMVGQTLEDDALRTPRQQDTISTPPRLWPKALSVGQVWIVGPFERLGLNQVARMQVVGRETVTVPAGTYPDAYKVTGYGHVFDGTQLLKAGRLVTDHGTLETTTWFVPGLGPVKEESKLHIHQAYFPATPVGSEIPLVVEEVSTRSLSEFQLGR